MINPDAEEKELRNNYHKLWVENKRLREALEKIKAERNALTLLLAEANNKWRHEFDVEVGAALDKLFKRLSYTSARSAINQEEKG